MAAINYRRRRERRDHPIPRIFRDRTHPLDHFDDTGIYAKFRFRRNDILEICDATNGRLERPNRTGVIPPVLQILLALRFYACGTFQDVCGELIGVHQTTASRVINRVTRALLPLAAAWIPFPAQADADRSKAKFYERGRFPNVFGCIDGTQIRIESPGSNNHEVDYVNRKIVPSINVQVSIIDVHS